jgi:SRSO17 transposase
LDYLVASDFGDGFAGIWRRGLMIRRNLADGDLAFFTTWCPKDTPIEALVKVRECLS